MAGKGTAAEYLRNSPNYKITAGPVSAKSKGTSDRHSPRKKNLFSFMIQIFWYNAATFLFGPKVTNANFLNGKLGHIIMAFLWQTEIGSDMFIRVTL